MSRLFPSVHVTFLSGTSKSRRQESQDGNITLSSAKVWNRYFKHFYQFFELKQEVLQSVIRWLQILDWCMDQSWLIHPDERSKEAPALLVHHRKLLEAKPHLQSFQLKRVPMLHVHIVDDFRFLRQTLSFLPRRVVLSRERHQTVPNPLQHNRLVQQRVRQRRYPCSTGLGHLKQLLQVLNSTRRATFLGPKVL